MPNTNVRNAAAIYLEGSISQLVDFTNLVDCEVRCRKLAGDKRNLSRIRADIHHEIHKIVEDAKEEEIEQAQLAEDILDILGTDRTQRILDIGQGVLDRRGIDRANDFQNFEEAYARGEI